MKLLSFCAFLLILGGCATPRPKPVAVVAPFTNASYGTILVARPAEAAPGVLAAIGERPGADDPATEFIVREDDGDVISVIEPGGTRLTPGQRVMIVVHGPETSLAAATQE
jgi:outer membrane lipoprotein SlyB